MNENKFKYKGIKFKAIPITENTCLDCALLDYDCGHLMLDKIIPHCLAEGRKDMRDVIFVEVEDEKN